MSEGNYTLLTDEPYTSELYSSLLEPAFNQVRESYTQYGLKLVPKNKLLKEVCKSAAKGAAIGLLKATTTVAVRNMNKDYEKQEKKGPKDLFFINYYTNPKKYPEMLRGLTSELKVEMTYQSCQKSLAAVVKFLLHPMDPEPEFHQTLGIGFLRSFTSNLITASTVYPLSLYAFTDNSLETVLRKSLRRSTVGSVMASMRSIGLSILTSLLPRQRDMFAVLLEIL